MWLSAAVGMACGAGLPVLAVGVTGGHFVVVFGFPFVVRWLPRSRWTPSLLQVSYQDGRGILRDVLVACTQQGFAVSRLKVERQPVGRAEPDRFSDLAAAERAEAPEPGVARRVVTVILELQGVRSIAKLAARLSDIDGVVSVAGGDGNVPTD